ncbi:MAG TPA: MFS transporter [Ktedonobacterales bacterium]|nr:MFS transporter [Ktedonobacterales bacterium]
MASTEEPSIASGEVVDISSVSGAPQQSERSPGARLWHNRGFNIFWAGQLLSAMGDSFVLLAMPLLVFDATGSVAQMGLVTGTFGVGQIVSGLVSGVIVDRVDRRRLMILCDLLRLALYGSIPLVWLLMGPQLWLIYVVVALGAMLGMTFQVAMITALTNLVDRDQLTDANARASASFSLALVIGPLLAGVLSARVGPVASVAVDALSFAISALTLTWIRLRRASAERPTESSGASLRRTAADFIEGIHFLLDQPVIRVVTLLLAGLSFVMAGMMDLFIFHLKNDLHQSDNAIGLLVGLAGIGGVGGGLAAPWLRRRVGFGASWLGGWALTGISCVLIGLAPSLWPILICAVGYTFGDVLSGTNSYTLRQELTPDHLLGRVTATFWTITGIASPVGAASLTLLASRVGGSAAIVIGGLGFVGLTIIGFFTPARRRYPERDMA